MKTTTKHAGIRILIVPALMCIFCLLYSCTTKNDPVVTPTPTPGGNNVLIQSSAFSPATITVTAGATVTWTNKDAIAHTVTSDASLFDSGSIGANGAYSYTFATAGTYPYHCTFHTMMTGTVIVNAASTSGTGY